MGVLDEPTNYLDRDGLGALVKAIEEFEGGVIIISHNKEFCSAVATEKWIMKAGILKQEGESVEKEAKEVAGNGNKEEEEVRDAAGNIIDMKKEAKLAALNKELEESKAAAKGA